MSSGLDLGPVLDIAAGVALAAIETVGTVGDLIRPGLPGAVNPDTAVAAAATDTVLATGVRMIVIPDTPGGEQRVYPGALEAQDPRWRVILPPSYTDLRRGDHVAVTASRDPRLVESRWELTVLLDNATGVTRTALAKRVPIGGQT